MNIETNFVMKSSEKVIEQKEHNETVEHEESSAKRIKVDDKERIEKGKKKKYILLISYSGKNYYGMQIIKNDPLPTIEEELFDAMIKAELIEESSKECPQSIRFQRAARTDKGVSAIKQIVSLKLRVDPEINIPKLINEYLPACIRVMGALKVTKMFDAKNFCDFRTYSYTAPTFAFAPNSETPNENYRITPEILSQLEKTLEIYLGTHSYHNFSSRVKSTEERAKRYIMKVGIDGPYIHDEMEFVRIKIRGQSFMMHQIRKMVGFAIGICRGVASTENLLAAFKNARSDIPIAPGLGLVLEEPHFETYNKKFSDDGIHEQICWDAIEDEIEEFRKKFINQNIVDTEKKEKVTLSWLETLNYHSFAEDRLIGYVTNNENVSVDSDIKVESLEKKQAEDKENLQKNINDEVSS